MRCNIDARGKAVRLRVGIAVGLVGLIPLLLWSLGVLRLEWVVAVAMALVIGGGFMIFEGWAGWCVVRALGIRTRV
ncbi:MAG: hypothetical protein L0219_01505 [Phycisphaerales bacterium]|nr:hypothetical protein [Phycisphaerales bacterium]